MNQLRSTFSVQAFEATAYVALSAVLGGIAFFVLVPTLALAVPLLVVALAGLPLIVFAFALCHLLARVERQRIKAVFGTEFPTRHLPRDGRLPSRAIRWVGSRGAWMELCYAVVALPVVGWIGSALVFFAWGAALAFLSFPLWGLFADGGGTLFGLDAGYAPVRRRPPRGRHRRAVRRPLAGARRRGRAGGDGAAAAGAG